MNPLLEFQTSLQLPRYRQEDWFKFIESFFTRCDADSIGMAMEHAGHPELILALARMQAVYNLPTERISGLLQGIALVQFMHFTKQLRESEPPMRIKIEEGE